MTKFLALLRRHWRLPTGIAALVLLAAVPLLRPSIQGAGNEDVSSHQIIVLTSEDIELLGTPSWGTFRDRFGLEDEMIRRSIEATQNDAHREQIALSRSRADQFMIDPLNSGGGHAILVLGNSP